MRARSKATVITVGFSDTADVRRIWLDTLVWGLAFRLAQKFNVERVDMCEKAYSKALAIAKMESRARSPIVMYAKSFGRSRLRRA